MLPLKLTFYCERLNKSHSISSPRRIGHSMIIYTLFYEILAIKLKTPCANCIKVRNGARDIAHCYQYTETQMKKQ